MNATTTQAALKLFLTQCATADGATAHDDDAKDRALAGGIRRVCQDRRWGFLRARKRIVTTAPYVTGTVDIAANGTDLTFAGATLTSGMAGRTIKFGGEATPYQILSVNTGAGTAVLVDAYPTGGVVTSFASFEILAFGYDLPSDFGKVIGITRVGAGTLLQRVTLTRFEDMRGNQAGNGIPYWYTIAPKLNDTLSQILLWPAPDDDTYQWDLWYHRKVGWLEASSRAWKLVPTSPSDIVDWPDELIPVLRAAMLTAYYDENPPERGADRAEATYSRLLAATAANDDDFGEDLHVPDPMHPSRVPLWYGSGRHDV